MKKICEQTKVIQNVIGQLLDIFRTKIKSNE